MIVPFDWTGPHHHSPHPSLYRLIMMHDPYCTMMRIHPVYPAPTPVSIPKDSAGQHSSHSHAPRMRIVVPAALPARMRQCCNVPACAFPRERSVACVPRYPARNIRISSMSHRRRDRISLRCKGRFYSWRPKRKDRCRPLDRN